MMRRLLAIRARWAAPGRWAVRMLAGTCVAILAGGAWLLGSLLGAPSAGETIAAAYQFISGPLHLTRARDVAWQLAVRDSGGLGPQTDALLSPPLPPALCAAGLAATAPEPREEIGTGDFAGPMATRDLDRLIRRADRAMATWNRPALATSADALRGVAGRLDGQDALVARYALARILAAGNDFGSAAGLLDGIAFTAQDGGGLPIVASETATRSASTGSVTPAAVLLAFHSRYLAGLVAYRRDQPVVAVAHFRRALNAVNYHLIETAGPGGGGHYERVDMAPGILSCGAGAGSGLTSLDAYAGLVAAYMAAPGFRDTGRLAGEVRRRSHEIDPNDPLLPLLRYAQEVAGRRDQVDRTAVPEHVFWASSNLQRVYHYNRLRPDPRLAVTRAVLTLRLLDEPGWTAALGLDEVDRCDMLAEVASGLRQDGDAMGDPGSPLPRADSVWAAVAVHTIARIESGCPHVAAGEMDGATRERLLELGGGLLHSGLVARYERWRKLLQDGGSMARGDTAAQVLRLAASDARFFGGGRVPPDMSAGIDPGTGAAFAGAWWRAVFRDVATQLVEEVESGEAPGRIRARDAARYLGTVNAAVAHAGLRPADVYRAETLEPLTRSQGDLRARLHGLRYHARSVPRVTAGVVALLTVSALLVAVLVFVNWWRFSLLTRASFYGAEAARRTGAVHDGERAGGGTTSPRSAHPGAAR